MTKDEKIAFLEADNAQLLQGIAILEEKVMELLQIIENQAVKKDSSSNSHNPPSQDKSKPKRNRSLRAKSKRKSRGQKEYKGCTLEMSQNLDKIEVLQSNYCIF